LVGVRVAVGVNVLVGVAVGEAVGVSVTVGVRVTVAVASRDTTRSVAMSAENLRYKSPAGTANGVLLPTGPFPNVVHV
jgi:hypothetical protein